MSVLLRGKCVRLCRNKLTASRVYSRGIVLLNDSTCRGTGLLPLAVDSGIGCSRGYLTTTTGKHVQSDSTTKSTTFKDNISPSSSIFAVDPISSTRTISKRYQHAHALEETTHIDNAPIIVSYPEWIKPQDTLPRRHIGPSDEEITTMLKSLNQPNLDAFIRQTIPDSIRASKEFKIPSEQTPETEMLDELTKAGKANSAAEVDTYIGMGYHPTITPGVIKRNVLENPGWYTSYTPYQPEISQGPTFTLRY
jgi:hypothetical protein